MIGQPWHLCKRFCRVTPLLETKARKDAYKIFEKSIVKGCFAGGSGAATSEDGIAGAACETVQQCRLHSMKMVSSWGPSLTRTVRLVDDAGAGNKKAG